MSQRKSFSYIAAIVMVTMLLGSFIYFGNAEPISAAGTNTTTGAIIADNKAPKYVFLFIGDGMSYPQIQSASYYLGAVESKGDVRTKELSFMNFPVAGSAQTYDSTSFAPDSASTATSIATGNKTYSGTINMDTTMTVAFEAISEKLKAQKGYKIGVVTSVNLNHATPAAFYAHQASRGNYYEIGLEMVESNFEYFAGGALLKPTGDGTQADILELAEFKGYTVATTQEEAEKIDKNTEKAIIIAEMLDSSDAMHYQLDVTEGEWVLADYVSKGIEVLNNDKGFFMMVEGGKIDWAGHANDAASNIYDTIAFSDAVDVAIDFYKQHPNDTLIIVTGDHETGGMSIGFAGLDYDLYLTNLSNQKISFTEYDDQYVANYKENNASFDDVMKDVKNLFGLMTADDADAAKNSKLVLTDYELAQLKKAYDRTLRIGGSTKDEMTQEEYVLYGTYEPLSVTITHILNNKSGIAFTSYAHTGLPVPVFATGVGAGRFEGYYDNTDIYFHMAKILNVK